MGCKGSGILPPVAAPILTQHIPACLSSPSEGASLPIGHTVWICTNHLQADDLRNTSRELIPVIKFRTVQPGPRQSQAEPLCQVQAQRPRQPCLWGYGQSTQYGIWPWGIGTEDDAEDKSPRKTQEGSLMPPPSYFIRVNLITNRTQSAYKPFLETETTALATMGLASSLYLLKA